MNIYVDADACPVVRIVEEVAMKRNKCYCCQVEEVEPFDICDNCGWQNDGLQNENPSYAGGANILSLNEYKKEYLKNMKY